MSNKTNKVHEPLFHIVKRSNNALPTWMAWVVRIIAVLLALVFCGVITVLLTGEDPLKVYSTMFNGAFGSERKIWALAQNTAILLCVSLAVTPAFKMKFWNIGAEGQVLMGGLATTTCMILFSDKMPTYIFYPVMIITSLAAGALWAVIPAFFKAKWNTNETLFTLMMNYIAMQIVSYFCYIWSVPKGSGHIGIINDSTHIGWLPKIGDQSYLCNIIIVAVLTVVMFIYFKYSKHGYEISVVGESENTAKYIGINVKKVIIRTMLLSGAICGIAGLLLVSGTDHTIARDTAGGRGFTAIMVSWLAHFNPASMVITALLISFFERGAGQISTNFGLNDSFSDILTGIIIFFIIGSEFFINYEVKFRQKEANK
ncbi:MAG: ABC transporter permease [Ruminococcus sp.]|nr:ABC transporter permease [Candidatus Copronaster equi]